MKNYLFSFLTSVTLVLSGFLYAQGSQKKTKTIFLLLMIDYNIFFYPEDRYFYSKSVNENTNLLDLKDIKFYSLKIFGLRSLSILY